MPNVVRGASIWSFAGELNGAELFDGHLLVPVVEGDALAPSVVRWDTAGLVPLGIARRRWPSLVADAEARLVGVLERVARKLATEGAPEARFREALTLPSVVGDAESYFYSQTRKKLVVLGWGADPRALWGAYVFRYEEWAALFRRRAASYPDERDITRPAARGATQRKLRPWWLPSTLLLATVVAALLVLLVLRGGAAMHEAAPRPSAAAPASVQDATSRGDDTTANDAAYEVALPTPSASDAARPRARSETASESRPSAATAPDDLPADAVAPSPAEADEDAAGAHHAAVSHGEDGGLGGDVLDSSAASEHADAGEAGPRLGAFRQHADAGDGGLRLGAFRRHAHADAAAWRVTGGAERLARTEQHEGYFDVWLLPGKTFDGVRIEWQDRNGRWHPH